MSNMKLYYACLLCISLFLAGTSECAAFAPTPYAFPKLVRSQRSLDTTTPRTVAFAPPATTATRTSSSPLTRRLSVSGILEGPVVAGLVESALSSTGNVPFSLALGINTLLFGAFNGKLKTMLTPTGFSHAAALGTVLWTTLGWKGWTLCVVYLILGQVVTKVRFKDKEQRGLAQSRGGRRGPENVWGSAATGLVCAACAAQGASFLGLGSELYLLGYVASLSTKLADTFASEIGKAYGKTTFLITTLARVEPGTEGAVSAEGTAAAVVGGFLLSLYGYAVGLIGSPGAVAVSTVAAFLATNVESLIGATLQEKKGFEWMTNEVVNFFNTLIGAGIAIAGGVLVLGMS